MRHAFRTNAFFRQIKSSYEILSNARHTKFDALLSLVTDNYIEYVIDIGANVGQFALDLRRAGYRGEIVSFEPVTKAFEALRKNARGKKGWKVFNLAIGSQVGEELIQISNNDSLSSSFRNMSSLHLQNFPNSYFNGEEIVSVSTLDYQLNILKISPAKCLLKVDVQGFEREVLLGGVNSIPKIPFCIIEGSLNPLYEGEFDLRELLNCLQQLNHHIIEIFPGVRARNSRLLQVDIISTSSENVK